VVTNVPQHVRVGAGNAHAPGLREVPKAAGGGVPVHPPAVRVEQDRPCRPAADGAIDRAADRGRQRDKDHLGSFAAHPEDAVAMLLTQVGDVRAGGFEDAQAEQSEHRDDGEVGWVG
jgi:hypothetical protein